MTDATQDPHTSNGSEPPKGALGIGTLLNDTMDRVTNLVRGEFDLARAEVSENLGKAGMAVGFIVVAVILTMLSLNILATAVVAGLVELGIEAWLAAIIVGGVLALIAVALLLKGINSLKLSSLAPTRTARNIKRDAAAIKESYNG